jgi:hypothetical protein
MIAIQTSPPPLVLLLADHLDAVLAAGEDILKLEVDIEAARKADGATGPWERFGDVVALAKLYELTIVSRVLQARNRCAELARQIGRDGEAFAAMLGLFAGGTAVLEEAVAELANRAAADFDMGLDPLAYLRTRNVMPADAGSLAGSARLLIGEDFLVARRIELGPLLDMSAALLDALDVAYSLFDEEAVATLVRDDARGGAGAVADGDSVQR